MTFSHLHCHTQYSLLDGASNIGTMVDKAVADNMKAVAITDHGNMFGVFKFVAECQKKNIKPIVGCEFYVVEDRHKKAFTKENLDKRYHQLMLAKNATGYQNLSKLCSLGYIEGLYSKWPRIDKELVEKYHEGLIATTCCLGAMIPQYIMNESEEKAEEEFKWWLNIFGEDFYVELQRHSLPEQEKVNEVLLRFAKKYNVKTIATNDSHYVNQPDNYAHDILLCVNTGEFKSTPIGDGKAFRFGFPNDNFYFKTTDEMSKLFADVPEAIDNTNEIADKIEKLTLKKDILLPAFPIPSTFNNADDYLRHLTMEGAMRKYSTIDTETEERLNFELETIRKMGFAGYFLIVSDFIRKGKEIGVMVGPGRGSAAGSAVAFCIDITNIDPIKYNLLFERFLNPDRKSMPDIDTDFDDEGRQKVIDYVVEKYGKNQVAQIVTYGTMAAKSSIKDVARVMELPLNDANALVKFVADKPGTSLKRLLNAPLTGKDSLEEKEELKQDDIANAKRLREIRAGSDLQAKVLQQAEFLEGSVRNTGIHAAGIIIAPKDLTELIPVYIQKDSPLWVTQIEGTMIEDAGVIKMDFLGLKTLSIIKNALQLIEQNHGVKINIDTIPLDDKTTFDLYQSGNVCGIFQFEADHVPEILKRMKPNTLDDLIALNALNRPGPQEYIPNYINRKHGKEKVEYDLPELEEYLKETYGITVYQEQVMLLSQSIAGFSKGDADVLRKAMGKKQLDVLEKKKEQFITGGMAKGHPKAPLEKIWTDWTKFAQYAFNKSHSACYAVVSYQTAYLKAHYPHEFMAALLNNSASIDKITYFMEECKRMNIDILGPNINESGKEFLVNKAGKIRFALSGIKGLGDAAVEGIMLERNSKGAFTSFFDMMKRVNLRTTNKKSLEALAMAGALDDFNAGHRAQYFEIGKNEGTSFIESCIRWAGQV
ncbi:MAG: polymerase subunit alpha, partial [Bacteroidota bacterium]